MLVDARERIGGVDLLLHIAVEERVHIVPGHAQGHLGQVVGAEAEELRVEREFIGGEGGPRHFDHGANLVVDLDAGRAHYLAGDAAHDRRLVR